MDPLSILTAPTVLYASISTLKLAWQILAKVESHKHRSRLLVERCQSLLIEVCKDLEQGNHKGWYDQLQVLEHACFTVRDSLTNLAGKGLAWRLLHYDSMGNALAGAESKLMDAFMSFYVGAQVVNFTLQKEIADATAQDNNDLRVYLDRLSGDGQKILDALQEGQLSLEELLLALTKHVQSTGALKSKPSDAFINTAVGALQRLSRNVDTGDILHWQVTSLEVIFDKNDESSYLGAGGFGKVYRGQWRGETVAVKEMHMEESRMVDRKKIQPFKKEIAIWLRLSHPRIMPFYGACLEATQPFTLTRYCANGNVLEYLKQNMYANRVSILHQISSGMAYLHSQRVIHADLKAANILIGDDHKALISDFGLSQLKDQSLSHTNCTRAAVNIVQGTLRWMAPELIEGEPLDYPADVYSFGITSWEIYTGLTPFADIPDRAFSRRVIDRGERPAYPSTMNKALWNLIQQCWGHDSAVRPSFSTLEASIQNIIDENPRHSYSLPASPVSTRLYMSLHSIKQNISIQSGSMESSNASPSHHSREQTAIMSPPGGP
ncbi:kinase-like domain-containing protein [Cyathus striatus]|nr:kinase-like domain-containing protein [Cyathus striatus]